MSVPARPMVDRLAAQIDCLLYALDRGDFGDLRIGDAESAYIAGMREALAAYTADQAREANVARIAGHVGCDSATPSRRAAALDIPFQRFGWGMLTDEATAHLATRLDAQRQEADRLDAARRKLAETGAAERALRNRQRETGDLLAEAFPIPSSQKDAA